MREQACQNTMDAAPDPVRLVCLPYAGGSAVMYRSWPAELAGLASVRAVSLPGRAERWHLPLADDLHRLADQLTDELAAGGQGRIALFGYSLGALLGFEVARRLVAAGRPPVLLVVAACAPPGSPRHRRDTHTLPDPEFVDWIRELGATPETVLADREMMAILLPILRADVALSGRYRYRHGPPLPMPIVAIAGRTDSDAGPATMAGWARESELPLREVQLNGNHMFIEHHEAAVLTAVREALRAVAPVAERSSR